MTEKKQELKQRIWGIFSYIIYVILNGLFRIVHRELKKEQFDAFMQFVKFGLVGVTNTILSYVLYVVSLLLFRKSGWLKKYDYLVAQIIAFVISVAWSFYWNNRVVFTV